MIGRCAFTVILTCIVVSCSSPPPPMIDITHEKGREEAVDAVVTVFTDQGWVLDQVETELGLVSTGWRSGSGLARALIGPNEHRYVARIKEGTVELKRFTRVGDTLRGFTEGKGAVSEEDPILRAIRDALEGKFVVRQGVETQ